MKDIEFSFTVRGRTAAVVLGTVLYITGSEMIDWPVPRSAVIPVIGAEVAACVAAFLVIPALLRRRASRKGAGRG